MATNHSSANELGTRVFRLRPIMRQGTASSIPEAWTKYTSAEEARAGAKHMYHDDRVLRVMLVVDGTSSFVEFCPHAARSPARLPIRSYPVALWRNGCGAPVIT